MFYSKTIYGMGITPHPLLNGDEMDRAQDGVATGRMAQSVGVGLIGAGGVLSVKRMLETRGELGCNAISAAVRHELGHVLGVKDHCADGKCIMQENRDNGVEGQGYVDFLERFVKPGLDFCRSCNWKISAAVSRIRFGF